METVHNDYSLKSMQQEDSFDINQLSKAKTFISEIT